MCLESKIIFPKIAKKDIICYKVIDIKGYSIYNRSYQYDEHKTNKANRRTYATKCRKISIQNWRQSYS